MKRLTFLLILVLLCGVFVLGTINGWNPKFTDDFTPNIVKVSNNDLIISPSFKPPWYFYNRVDDYNGVNAKRLKKAIENGSFVEGYSFATEENSENPMLNGGNYAYIYLTNEYLNGKTTKSFHLNVEDNKIVWDRRFVEGDKIIWYRALLYNKPDLEEPAKIKVVYTPKMSENVKAYVKELEAYAKEIRKRGEVLLDGQTYGDVLIPNERYTKVYRDLIDRLGLKVIDVSKLKNGGKGKKRGIIANRENTPKGKKSKRFLLLIDEEKLEKVLTFEARSPPAIYNSLYEGQNFNKIEVSKLIGKNNVLNAYIKHLAKLYDSIRENNPKLLKKIKENGKYVAYKTSSNICTFENVNLEDGKLSSEEKAILILAYAFDAREICEEITDSTTKKDIEKLIIENFSHNFVNAEGFGLNYQLHGAKLNFDLLKENVKGYRRTKKIKTTMIKYGQFTFIFEPNRVAIVCSSDRVADSVVFDKTYDEDAIEYLEQVGATYDRGTYKREYAEKAVEQMEKDKIWLDKFYRSLSNEETRKQFEVYWFKQEDSGIRAAPEQGLNDDGQAAETTYSPLMKSAVGEFGGMHMLVMKWVDPDTKETHVHLISTYRVDNGAQQIINNLMPADGSPLVPFERELVIPKGWEVKDIAVDVLDPNEKNNYIRLVSWVKISKGDNNNRYLFDVVAFSYEGNRLGEALSIVKEEPSSSNLESTSKNSKTTQNPKQTETKVN